MAVNMTCRFCTTLAWPPGIAKGRGLYGLDENGSDPWPHSA